MYFWIYWAAIVSCVSVSAVLLFGWGKEANRQQQKLHTTTFFQEENSFSQPTLRIWPSSGYKSRILRSSRMREGRMVERSSPSESWLSEAETRHSASASDHSAIERNHHLITVPSNDIAIWSQCHWTTSPSDHSAIERHHHLITVPLNDITIWSQCHWMTSPSDQSAIEWHHHLITVPLNDITIWSQCHWSASPSDHSAIERHHHLITVPSNDITIWSQCHWMTSPSDQGVDERLHCFIRASPPDHGITAWYH